MRSGVCHLNTPSSLGHNQSAMRALTPSLASGRRIAKTNQLPNSAATELTVIATITVPKMYD